jgi:hypothetical protein
MDPVDSHVSSSAAGMMEGLQIGDGIRPSKQGDLPPTLQLTDTERQILELYDNLEEIQLESSIWEAEESMTLGKHVLNLPVFSHDLRFSRTGRRYF